MITIIGEIGINHNGSLRTALRLIKECKECGVDIVKFQKRTPEICVPDDQKNVLRDTPWGKITYLEYKKRIEFKKKQYDIIDEYCKRIGIQWTASVWDIPSLDFIKEYDVPFVKIPSALITDGKLISAIKHTSNLPVVISGGMSTVDEITEAGDYLGDRLLSILHCNSTYPCPHNECDIRAIDTLRKRFVGVDIGYSGHEIDVLPTIVAVSRGAKFIERHITLDKNMWGTDQKASLNIDELRNLVDTIRQIEIILGDYKINVYPGELEAMKRLRNRSPFLDKYS